MKKLNKFLLPVLALGMMTACSDDKNDGPANPAEDTSVDRVQYLNISIQGFSGNNGRAEDITIEKYLDATDDKENKISQVYMVFYDKNGNLITSKSVTDKITGQTPSTSTDSEIEEVFKSTIEIELEKGQLDPAFVMCYVNPISLGTSGSDASVLAQPTIGDIKGVTRKSVYTGSGENIRFGMSNSVYYGSDNVLVRATPIPPKALYKSEEEATGEDKLQVAIYVERYAAKVGLRAASENYITPYETTDKVFQLKFVPDKWGLNAREQEFFVSKNYTQTSTPGEGGPMGTNNLTYTDMQNALGTSAWWNGNHRSFWGRSVSFFKQNFPEVSDDIKITDGKSNYSLTYNSWNDIASSTSTLNVNTEGTSTYAMENTIGVNADRSKNLLAALSSAVIAGHYELTKKSGVTTNTYPANTTFYIFEDKVYFDPKAEKINTDDATICQGLLKNNNIIFTQESESSEPVDLRDITGLEDLFDIYHPTFDQTGTKYDEQQVALRIKENTTDEQLAGKNLYFRKGGNGTKLTASNISELNGLLLGLGTANAYTTGKAFFSIPIQHLGIYNHTTGQEIITDNGYNWANFREGDFGIVRNHIYDLKVSSIKGLANGVYNPDKPIVPEKSKTTYHVNYLLNIHAWKVLRTQNVNL